MNSDTRLKRSVMFIYHYLGIKAIYAKINPPDKDQKKPPTFALWALGIYVALYGIVSQRYEASLSASNNNANYILSQDLNASNKNILLWQVALLQQDEIFTKPTLHNPISVLLSFVGIKEQNSLLLDKTKKYLSMNRKSLNDASLMMLDISNTDLSGANFSGSYLLSVNFDDSNLVNSNFSGSQIELSSFINSSLGNANMENCLLLSVLFINCNMTKTNFTSLNDPTKWEQRINRIEKENSDNINSEDIKIAYDTSSKDNPINIIPTKNNSYEFKYFSVKRITPYYADFNNCNMRKAKFDNANLDNIKLNNSDLSFSNITASQICSTVSANNIKTNTALTEQLVKQYPARFQ